MTALEDLATQQARWADLLVLYRRRSELEKDEGRRVDLLYKIAFIDEERAGNLESAAATYEKILERDRKAQRAVRALVKVQGARGDAAGLARALEMELELASENESRVNLLLRLGQLYEEKLGKRRTALDKYAAALSLAPAHRGVHAALERFLAEGSPERVEVARLLGPVYERALTQPSGGDGDLAARLAAALEIVRGAEEDVTARLAHDRRLVALYARKLRDPLNAYDAAARVLVAAPRTPTTGARWRSSPASWRRTTTSRCSSRSSCGRKRSWRPPSRSISSPSWPTPTTSGSISPSRPSASGAGCSSSMRRARTPTTPSSASCARPSAGRTCAPSSRSASRSARDPVDKREILLQITDLYEGVLDNAAGAMGAYRRVLELEPGPSPSSARAYRALERLYDQAQLPAELEELLGRELQATRDEKEIASLTYRRAELRANKLSNASGAVDLAEEVLRREPGHAGARQLLEGIYGGGAAGKDLRLRIARLLGPLYEADGKWADRIRMLQGERELAGGAEAVELLAQIAAIQEEKLLDAKAAFGSWRQAVLADPEDNRSRSALERLARALESLGRGRRGLGAGGDQGAGRRRHPPRHAARRAGGDLRPLPRRRQARDRRLQAAHRQRSAQPGDRGARRRGAGAAARRAAGLARAHRGAAPAGGVGRHARQAHRLPDARRGHPGAAAGRRRRRHRHLARGAG
jgi:hypothetical protein